MPNTSHNPRSVSAYVDVSFQGASANTARIDEAARLHLALDQPLQFLDLTFDTILIHDLTNRIVFWNRAAEEMYGWTWQEALGQTAWQLLRTSSSSTLDNILHAVQESGRWEGELLHTRRDGSQVAVASRWALQSDARGKPQAIVEINRDITALKRAEEEQRYIAGSARCLLWHADVAESGGDNLTWRAELYNPDAAQAFLPLSLQPGESYMDARYRCRVAEDRETCDRLGFEAIRAGRSYSQEFRTIAADGTVRWSAEDVRVEAIVSGQRWRIVAVCTDITERKMAEEAVADLNARLRRAMRETHHRVKNNLQVIAALADLQAVGDGGQVPAAAIHRISQHVRSLAGIHDLLTSEAKDGEEERMLSAEATLRRLLPVLNTVLHGRELEWKVQDVRLPARQATALSVLVNELISNAVKHGAGDISLSLTAQGDMATLTVSDNGPGFPPGFDPIKRANTGVELIESVSRWDLQGTTQYSNRPEGGARVAVMFPLPLSDTPPGQSGG